MYKKPKAKKKDIIIIKWNDYDDDNGYYIQLEVLEAITKAKEWEYIIKRNETLYTIEEKEILENLTTNKKYIKRNAESKTVANIEYCTEKEFSEFWELYPKNHNRRVDKKGSKKKYLGIEKQEHIKVLKGLKILKGTESWVKGFEPMVSTFLNQRRWVDVSEENKKGDYVKKNENIPKINLDDL